MRIEATPKTQVTTPSMMKIQAQPGRCEYPSRFSIAAARRPPKEPETAAAEKKIA
jgi:predicted TIM-barrel fold metal-dependent hydrolase